MIGIVGRLTEVKNHSLFLRVARLWQERNGGEMPGVRFVIVGDGHLREKLESEARELNLQNTVFLGERNDPEIFYPALDIVALTSFNEGTPLTLIEAMANCRPVISTAVGGTIDLLGAPAQTSREAGNASFSIGERGVLVPPNNAESFFQGLSKLVKDGNLRENLGNRSFEFVRENYSKERLLDDIRRLYGSL